MVGKIGQWSKGNKFITYLYGTTKDKEEINVKKKKEILKF